ncbi:hypothetical protein ACFE04_022719 [Oxalis oulophora]
MLGSMNSRSRNHSNQTPCTRTHQIAALLLVVSTFFLSRLFDQLFNPSCNHNSLSLLSHAQSSESLLSSSSSKSIAWPQREFLKIYVYDESEIDGLKLLLYGRDGNIKADACLKGQWGTQVKIHKFLLQSKLRTRSKEEADLFFVPSYVKCVRMMGGLSDKEINQMYIKILSQMPYFRRSGGRDHVFVFPRFDFAVSTSSVFPGQNKSYRSPLDPSSDCLHLFSLSLFCIDMNGKGGYSYDLYNVCIGMFLSLIL